MGYEIRDRSDGMFEVVIARPVMVGIFPDRIRAESYRAWLSDHDPELPAEEPACFGQALKDVARLNAEIADLREALSIQRAEWAYLNRPDRLRDLVNLNFAALELLPMSPDQFGAVAEVAYPDPNADQTETKPGLLDDLAPIDVIAPPDATDATPPAEEN